jgi:hypothetical protein
MAWIKGALLKVVQPLRVCNRSQKLQVSDVLLKFEIAEYIKKHKVFSINYF